MKNREIPALWYGLAIAAAISFIPSLFFPYVGEEGVYTITTLEMLHNHLWSNPLLYGSPYGRPPFLNWVMLPLTVLLGPQHVLIASRFVAGISTLLTAAVLHYTVRVMGQSTRRAWLTTLVFLSSDALIYHGWLAYSDPLFGLLAFGAMACVLICAYTQRTRPLALAAVLLFAAFLTKALTAYVFVFLTWAIVFLRHRPARRTLLSIPALICYAGMVIAPLAWFTLIPDAGFGGHEGGAMTHDILNKLIPANPRNWIKQIVSFPIETFCRFLPVTAFVAYGLAKGLATRKAQTDNAKDPWDTTIALVALANFLPYWLAPESNIRYILPIYPLIAYCLGGALDRMSAKTLKATIYGITAIIALKYVFLAVFPVYQFQYRGNAAGVARDIAATVKGARIYSDDTTSTGLAIAANVDSIRWPIAPISWAQQGIENGWIITQFPNRPGAKIVKTEVYWKDHVYLLCSGQACNEQMAVK